MAVRFKPIDANQVQTGSIRRRVFRLGVDHLASMPEPTRPLQKFYHTLPRLGKASELLTAAQLIATAALEDKPLVWLIDGHFMTAGLSPQLVYLIRRNLARNLVMNGEAAVCDYELAFHGVTDEDPVLGLQDGLLGLTRETGEGINSIINEGVKRGFSIGECLGRGILERQPKHFANSLLATGAARLSSITVHLSVGADGFQRYPGADGAMLGKGSLKDTQILSSQLSTLPPGTIFITLHRDTALTQVFLNAVAMARNLNQDLRGFNLIQLGAIHPTLADLPALEQTLALPGPIEIMMPLLVGALFSLVE